MRFVDRLLARADALPYNEMLYSGAYQVSGLDAGGRYREGMAEALVRQAREAYEQNGIVAACVTARMALLSEARFQFRSSADGHLFGTPDLVILEKPWPNATSGELWSRLEQDDSTAGQSYIRRVSPADESPPHLLQLRPECVTIVSELARDSDGRRYKRVIGYAEDVRPLGIDAEPQVYTPDEVAHFSPLPDPRASWRGMSWLTPVLREIGADHALTRYKTAHLDNGAMPGLVVKYSRKLNDQTVQTLAKRLSARHGGPDNAGKVIVLDEGADMAVAGSNLEQLQADLITRAGERRICAAAQVPLEVVGLDAGDYQAAMRRFADLFARPHWRMACAVLQHLVPNVPDTGVRLWFDVSDIAALREGELQRGQTTLVKSQAVAAFVAAGFTRDTSIQAADTGDISLLKPDPKAPPPGGSGGNAPAGPGGGALNGRAPQAGKPEDLPGVGHPNAPNALPAGKLTVPAVPGGPRGNGSNGRHR